VGGAAHSRATLNRAPETQIVMIRNTDHSWGAPAVLLHWLVALLVFVQFGLGWAAVSWRMSPTKLDLFVWHKSIGMLVLLLVIGRLVWRALNVTPALPADTPPLERIAARLSHGLLYALLLLMPLTGWIINSAANVPFRIFWQVPLPALVAPDKALADAVARVHLVLFVLLALLLILHVGAALRHHFVKRNAVLTRMLPGRGGAR
jgi:cytochrome b561